MNGPIPNALSRWNATPTTRWTMALIVLLPFIVAGLLVWSYWDPSGRMPNLPAALVNEDSPAKDTSRTVAAGDQLQQAILSSGTLDWTLTDMDDAQVGLDSGDYYLAVRIPADFSERIASLDTKTPQPADLEVITNDATNHAVQQLSETVVAAIEQAAAGELQLEFLDVVFAEVQREGDDAGKARTEASDLVSDLKSANKKASQVAKEARSLADDLPATHKAASSLQNSLGSLRGSVEDVAASAAEADRESSGITTSLTSIDDDLKALESELTARNEPQLAAQVDGIRTDLDNNVAKPNDKVTKHTSEAAKGATAAADSAKQDRKAAADLADALTGITDRAQTLSTNADELAALIATSALPGAQELNKQLKRASEQVAPITSGQKQAFADVLTHPVQVTSTTQNAVGAPGDAWAPYFMTLALFAFALILLLVVPALNPRLVHGVSPVRRTWSSFVPPATFGVLSALVLLLGLIAFNGVRAASYLSLVLVTVLAVVCFVAIVQLLRAALGVAGLYLGVILVVLQLASSGGILPNAVLGGVFQVLQPVLPLTYAVDGLRRSIAGGPLWPYVGEDLLVLLAFTAAALAATVLVARRREQMRDSDLHSSVTVR